MKKKILFILTTILVSCTCMFTLTACASTSPNNNDPSSSINTYTVTWKNYDGTTLEVDNVAYGETPSYDGNNPTRTQTAQNRYSFSGWSPSIAAVTGDVVYVAQFSSSINTYTVTWKNYDGEILEVDTEVSRGSMPSYEGVIPVKASDEEYDYIFCGWSPAISSVQEDVIYTAFYNSKERPIEINSIEFTQQDVYLFVGDTFSISYTVNPSKYLNSIAFKSYDPSIVAVDGATIIALSSGETKIIGYGPDGTKSTFNVYVIEEMALTLSVYDSLYGYISASTNSYFYLIGNSEENISGRLYYYEDYTNTTKNAYKIKFYSLDTSYFEVDETTGKVQCKDKTGIAKCRAVLYSPISSRDIEIPIGISNGVLVEKWTFYKTQYSLIVGGTATISGTYTPSNANIGGITFTSNDEKVATVDANGTITAKNVGSCNIIAYCETINTYYYFSVTVSGTYATSISTSNSLSVAPTETKNIAVSYTPSNANIGKNITYFSDNEEIAIVDNEGNVTGIRQGSCNITLTLENEYKTTVVVTVIESIYPESITLSEYSVTLKPNTTLTLSATIYPSTSNVYLVKNWRSSNTDIATVVNGKIKAIAPGNANIYVSLVNGIEACCQVRVLEYTRPTSITLSSTSLNIDPLSSKTIIATINPSNTDKDNKLIWSSTNENVAIVNSGVIAAIAPGACKIKVQAENGIIAICDVVVNPYTYPTSISLTATLISVDPNRTTAISATILPTNSNADLEISWSSSNNSIAKVEKGIILGVTPGSCTVFAELKNGVRAQCLVTVNDYIYAESLSLTTSSLSLTKESVFVITATYLPATANTGTGITYISSNSSIATVDASGIITGVSIGKCTITAKLENGYTKTCTVNVTDYIYAEKITLSNTSVSLNPSQSVALSYTITPTNTQKGKNVTWSSSDNLVATVSNEGIVKAINKGVCIITARLENGNTSTCKINVNGIAPIIYNANTKENYSNSLYINCTKGESIQLESNTRVTYYSSNTSVAYVLNDVLICVGAGTCNITATNSSSDNSILKVNVYDCTVSYNMITDIVDYEYSKNPNIGEEEIGKTISELCVEINNYRFINGKTLALALDINKLSGGFESSNVTIEIYDSFNNLICTAVASSTEKMLFGETVRIEKQIDLSNYYPESFYYNFKIKIVDSPLNDC